MAKGTVNKVILLGRLGQDPEVRNTASGTQVANLSVATTELGQKDDSGKRQEVTEWHRVTLWGKTAELAAQYLNKGSQVYIEGRLQTRKWQDQNGQDRYTTEIVGSEMQFIGGKSDGQAQGQNYAQAYAQPAQQPQQQYQQPVPQQVAPIQQTQQPIQQPAQTQQAPIQSNGIVQPAVGGIYAPDINEDIPF